MKKEILSQAKPEICRGMIMEEPVLFAEQKISYDIVHRRSVCTSHIPPHTHDGVEIYLSLSFLPNVSLPSSP